MDTPEWQYKSFDKLTVQELYAILHLRSKVFVLEQNCVYLDTDGKDEGSFHLCGWMNDKLIAYARILPPGLAFEEASIGRVVTDPSYRGNGAGKILMQHAIKITFSEYHVSKIKLGAQRYLLAFYTSLGFIQSGPEYLEDGIPHIEMSLVK